jgi:thiamine-monophosphate kinase
MSRADHGAADSSSESLATLGEDGLIADILAGLGALAAPFWVTVGPGDDAAVLDLLGPVVVSTDTLAEGPDFRLEWSGGRDVGVKSAAQNFADVAAMGAVPRAIVVSLAAPASLAAEWARDLRLGLGDECGRAGAVLVGGDVSGASEVVVTGTAIGVLDGVTAVRRSGARAGDVVALAGDTGHSAAGLALLLAGLDPADPGAADPDAARALALHLRPEPPYAAGPAAARAGATAMIDTSDGLLRDALRIAEASGVAIDLDPGALAPDAGLAAVAARLGTDPRTWVLGGGEDHRLLATFPPDAALPAPFREIGAVLAGDPAVTVGGTTWTGTTGWRHFSA